ncbi:DUF973 family protein [Sulfurisphaera tokodaii]|uniref:DUF973 family protein n=2 Tax=Sulfurisphaera tokodaii TaxID=111955 RepID=Q970J0_SULTO|nr:DUF973 family protein [Sulfurisphaera tokodaii]BAB66683.1 hypothetical protein STK_16050 [Sulfurisphaera tokodaii str. 7]HII73498.1 DUF973 family protein [Sulfurisphaera tokodaii]
MAQQNIEILGLEKLRDGALYYIIVSFLGIILGILTLGVSFSITGITSSITTVLIMGLISSLITLPLVILSFYRTKEGFSILVSTGKDLGNGITGTILILIGIVIGSIGTLVTVIFILPLLSKQPLPSILPSLVGGVIVLFIGGIIGLIGYILLALAYRRAGEIYLNDDLKNAGLLMIIGSVIGLIVSVVGYILILISFILVYTGLGNLLKRLSQTTSQLAQLQLPSGPISQVGIGTLRSNGIALVTINSQYSVQIISALLLGTNYTTSDISPNTLNIGFNTITINFRTALTLVTGNIYYIQLTLSNGQTLNVAVIYQP